MQSSQSNKLTVFKPPTFIYRLSKNTQQKHQNQGYDVLFNKEYSLRKYHQKCTLSQKQLQIYEWRKQSESPIVGVLYIELVNKVSNNRNLCQEKGVEVNIYTEHLEKTLTEIIDLRLEFAVYVLKNALLGFEAIFKKLGSVVISKGNMGINGQGKLKVWLNNDFWQNTADTTKSQQQIGCDILHVEPAIVNKVVHLMSLLSNSGSQFFFSALEKDLAKNKHTFSNCYKFINQFVCKNKLLVAQSLSAFVPSKVTVNSQHSCGEKPKQRRASQAMNFSKVDFTKTTIPSTRLIGERSKLRKSSIENEKSSANTKVPQFIRHTSIVENQRCPQYPKDIDQTIVQKHHDESEEEVPNRSRKFSMLSNEMKSKKNLVANRQRPSIYMLPSFIQSSNKQNPCSVSGKSFRKSKDSKKSFSLFQKSTRTLHGNNENLTRPEVTAFKLTSSVLQEPKHQKQMNLDSDCQTKSRPSRKCSEQYSKAPQFLNVSNSSEANQLRTRSASMNSKFTSHSYNALISRTNFNELSEQTKSFNTEKQAEREKSRNQNEFGSSEHSTVRGQKTSFMTKTNYDSGAQESEKIGDRAKMTYSNLSIDNIIKKDADSIRTSNRTDQKRSLMSFKYGFEEIMENPSFKQIQQENETKSYQGSSLQNTQNLIDTGDYTLPPLQFEDSSQNLEDLLSKKKAQKKMQRVDSTDEMWDKVKEKTEEMLEKNQWTKAIQNLGELDEIELNESIVEGADEVMPMSDIKLEKLDKLGGNLCFSLLKDSSEKSSSVTPGFSSAVRRAISKEFDE